MYVLPQIPELRFFCRKRLHGLWLDIICMKGNMASFDQYFIRIETYDKIKQSSILVSAFSEEEEVEGWE